MPSKPRRRDTGSGGLYQDSRGLWTAALTLPDGPDGTRRRKVVRSRSKAVAAEKLRKLRADLDKVGDLPTSSPTLAQWLTYWLPEVSAKRVRPRTQYEREADVRRYILPSIGRFRLDKLTADHVRSLHSHIIDDCGLSSTSALRCHRLLAVALRDAVRSGRVTRNVASADWVDAPRAAVSSAKSLTRDEALHLLALAAEDTHRVRWVVGLLTGARTGEVLGLEWDRLDWDAESLALSWQLQRLPYRHGCGGTCEYKRAGSCRRREIVVPAGFEMREASGGLYLVRPKTRAGWRVIPLAEPLRTILREEWRAAGEPTHGLMFSGANGGPLSPEDDFKAWKALRERAGLTIRRHDARHTAATLLMALGVDREVARSILGHSSAITTATYQHADLTMAREALTRLGEHLAPFAEEVVPKWQCLL